MNYRYSRICYAPNDGGGSTPGQSMIPNSGNQNHNQNNQNNQNQNNDNNQNNNQNNQNNQNNDQNNDDEFRNLWQTDDDTNNNNQNNQQQNNLNNQQQQQQQQSPQDVLDNHIKNLPLDVNIDPQKLSQELQEGNFTGLQSLLRESAQNAYKSAMVDANKIIKNKVEEAVDQAVQKAQGLNKADAAINAMNTRFPFTKDEAIKPVADAVLNQFLKKGASLDDAIEKVGQFHRRIIDKAHKEVRTPDDSKFRSGATDLNMNFGDDDNQDEPDWVNILTSQ